ncbi:MAG: N-acetyl-gamma-glutamyl-phosphate reductase [bacterium]
MIKVGIIGASGLTGRELLKIFIKHKKVQLLYATSRQYCGHRVDKVFPEFKNRIALEFILPDPKVIYSGVDVVFLCLPHTESMPVVKKFMAKGIKVIDLSADYRIKNPKTFKTWYGVEHTDKDMLKKAVYGLSEINRDEIVKARLIANPGCYPTSILLGIAPLMGKIQIESMIVDSKTGISGAGAKPTHLNMYVNVSENIIPYNVGRKHRHIGEVEDFVHHKFGEKLNFVFTPQIVPLDRGMLSVIYIRVKKWLDPEAVKKAFVKFYEGEPFVRIADMISVHDVRNTNYCDIAIGGVKENKTLIITTAIDNLIKGASGQAVQNMNIMFNVDEREGLE